MWRGAWQAGQIRSVVAVTRQTLHSYMQHGVQPAAPVGGAMDDTAQFALPRRMQL